MMSHKGLIWIFLFAVTAADAQQPDQEALVKSVFQQLLTAPAASKPTAKYSSWPPQVVIMSSSPSGARNNEQPELNAFAAAPDCKPIVRISEGLVTQVVQGDPDVLALILGHELGHILLGHPTCTPDRDRTSFLQMAVTRDQEYAADAKGYQLALAAGFSPRRGLRGLQLLDEVSHYSSFEALTLDHPSWPDRLARLDKDQEQLWRSMSAFNDGVSFLATESYVYAANCFRSVVREFPDAADVKSNLGYALLMQYIDTLSDSEVQSLGIGQIATGSFYGESLHLKSKVRGKDPALWNEAVQVLKAAEQLNPGLSLVKANLGLAYLVQPDGPDAKKALEYLVPALDLLKSDNSLHTAYGEAATHAVVNNTAIALVAAGAPERAKALLGFLWKDRKPVTNEQSLLQVAALYYNVGAILSTSSDAQERGAASTILLQFLRVQSADSPWWKPAYINYTKVCSESSDGCVSESQLRTSNRVSLRQVVAADLGQGKSIRVGESFQDAMDQLGPTISEGNISSGNIKRTRFSKYSFDVLSTDVVLAIVLKAQNGPVLHLHQVGTAGGQGLLKIGMSQDQVESLLASQPYRFEGLIDAWTPYRFYPGVGIALRMGPQKTVEEIVVVRSSAHTEAE